MALEFAAGWDAPLVATRSTEPIAKLLTQPVIEQSLREAKSRVTGNGRSKEILGYLERDFGPVVQVVQVELPGWIPNAGAGCAAATLEFKGLNYQVILRSNGGGLEVSDITA